MSCAAMMGTWTCSPMGAQAARSGGISFNTMESINRMTVRRLCFRPFLSPLLPDAKWMTVGREHSAGAYSDTAAGAVPAAPSGHLQTSEDIVQLDAATWVYSMLRLDSRTDWALSSRAARRSGQLARVWWLAVPYGAGPQPAEPRTRPHGPDTEPRFCRFRDDSCPVVSQQHPPAHPHPATTKLVHDEPYGHSQRNEQSASLCDERGLLIELDTSCLGLPPCGGYHQEQNVDKILSTHLVSERLSANRLSESRVSRLFFPVLLDQPNGQRSLSSPSFALASSQDSCWQYYLVSCDCMDYVHFDRPGFGGRLAVPSHGRELRPLSRSRQ